MRNEQHINMYGKIGASLEKHDTPIGPLDLLTAGHARSEGCVLVTNHIR